MSELKQFKLPDVGEGLTEADIVRWLVQPGDKISINQIIVEIETAKAVVELPSPYEGVVENLLVPEGTTADVGTPIISVQVGDAGVHAPAPPADAPAPPADISAPPAEGAVEPGIHGSPAPKDERQAVLVGYGVKLGATTRRARKPAGDSPASPARSAASPASAGSATRTAGASTTLSATSAVSPIRPAAEAATEAATGGARTAVLAKPPVRKLAKDLGVDLAGLTGTGPSGSITRDDIQAAAVAVEAAAAGAGTGTEAAGDAAPAAPAGPAGPAQAAAIRLASLPREERIAIRGVRK
ncbi:MAG TPA: biotin/lipoyl-containing protein, partial [Streptosporangiaceae bacterium]|nr:biotin/lipoyl-containing protein [Streptosporangiaceae bacterium]